MAATSAKWSDEVLKIASDHLGYEIEMFFKQGREGEAKKEKRDTGANLNALNEAFFVHARNLLNFLSSRGRSRGHSRGRKPDVKANHYLEKSWLGEPEAQEAMRALNALDWQTLINRVDKMILHLTYDRISVDQIKEQWPVQSLMDAMAAPLVVFYKEVKKTAPNTLHERLVKVMKKYCKCT
jgi:hypothetical protein